MVWKKFGNFSFTYLLLMFVLISHGVDAGELECKIKLNLNSVTEKELASIEGISPDIARNIVIFRKTHGPFRWLGTLLKVPGVTPELIKRIGAYTDLDGGIYCPPSPGTGYGDEWEEEPKLTIPKC